MFILLQIITMDDEESSQEQQDNSLCYGPKELLYKILVIGEFGVGKTSIIRRYTEGYFNPSYKLTIGVDFALKTLDWNSALKVNLQLWDIAGHERFGHMTRVYYKYAIAAVVVFDLTRRGTLDATTKWISDVHSKVMLTEDNPIPCLLLANKCDLPEADIDTAELNEFCRQNGILAWFPTSAKDDINIEEAINYLVQNILDVTKDSAESQELSRSENENNINVGSPSKHQASTIKCCRDG